jgi:phosphoribosyl-dephospho-CoA transferase
MTLLRPHDLLRVEPASSLFRDAPGWVRAALRTAPWVVIRRGRCGPGRIPVGIRGLERRQRFPTEVSTATVIETLSPPELLGRANALPDLPAAVALHRATEVFAPTELRWGPGGSVGFTLASGVCAITPESDLDLVLTAHRVPLPSLLADVQERLRGLPARVDVQLNLPIGGIAVDELLSGTTQVLLHTADGPKFTDVATLIQ